MENLDQRMEQAAVAIVVSGKKDIAAAKITEEEKDLRQSMEELVGANQALNGSPTWWRGNPYQQSSYWIMSRAAGREIVIRQSRSMWLRGQPNTTGQRLLR